MRYLLALAIWFSLPALRAEEPLPSYLVVAPEGMEERLVARVRDWMTANLHYDVRVERLPEWGKEDGAAQIEAVLGKVSAPGMVTVILSNHLPEDRHAVVDPKRMAGVVNVPLLVPEVNETTLRRLDRQAMRVVGFSLGIPPQPIPFCSLYPYRDLEQLDQIGRGFSPPAMALYRKQLLAKGFPLSPEAARRLPNVSVKAPEKPGISEE
jgi:hypothetical protein